MGICWQYDLTCEDDILGSCILLRLTCGEHILYSKTSKYNQKLMGDDVSILCNTIFIRFLLKTTENAGGIKVPCNAEIGRIGIK